MAEWVNDKLTGNRSVRGGNPSRHVVHGGLDVLAREALQNINDQSLGKGNPAVARFKFLRLSGKSRSDFLAALDWASHRRHLNAATLAGGGVLLQIKKGVQMLDDKSKALVCLRIDDENTTGLVGDEFDETQNFNLLCRAEFLTPERAGRGGFHGLGKGVLWRFSQISTVLFSSTLHAKNPRKGLRMFGRADIPSHKLGGVWYNYGGFFGNRVQTADDVYAESVWNDQALAKALQIHRDPRGPTGTTALIVGFFEPYLEQPRSLDDVAISTLRAAEEWFWPVMVKPVESLVVEAEVIDNGKSTFMRTGNPETGWAPFIHAFRDKPTAAKAKRPDDIAEKNLDFQIPARVDDHPHPKIETKLKLRATRGNDDLREHECANSIAHIRGAGMVVKYELLKKKPLDETPAFGVLTVGLQNGRKTDDERVEEFFRAAEPVLHNDWEYTDAIRDDYARGGGKLLTDLKLRVQDGMQELVADDLERKQVGPQLLAKHFPFGSAGPHEAKPQVQAAITKHEFRNPDWFVEGNLENLKPDGKDWKVTLSIFAEAESGRGDPMEITNITLGPGGKRFELRKGRAEITVTGKSHGVHFAAEAKAAEGLSGLDPRRTVIGVRHSAVEPAG